MNTPKRSQVFGKRVLSKSSLDLKFAILFACMWDAGRNSVWKGRGLLTQEPIAPLVACNFKSGQAWALTCSNFIKSVRHPGKRKGTVSETSAGSHSGQ